MLARPRPFVGGFIDPFAPGFRSPFVYTPDGQAFPETAAGLAAIVGATPTNIFTHNQASGNSVCLLTGTALAPQGSPTIGVVTSFGGGDRAVQMADNTAQRLQAASGDVFDQTTESFAWLIVANFGSSAPAATRFAMIKGSAAFYTLRLESTGAVNFRCFDGSITIEAAPTGNLCDGEWHCIIVGRGNGNVYCVHDLGSDVEDEGELDTITNINAFAIGRSAASAPQTATYHVRFTGAEADTLLANAGDAIAAFFKGP